MFTQFLYEMDQPEPSPEQPKIQVATPKQVEQFGNSPVRGVKPEDIKNHANKLLDSKSGRVGPQRGSYSKRDLLNQHINMGAYEKSLDPENRMNDQEWFVQNHWDQYVAARRDKVGYAPKPGKPGREEWEQRKTDWMKNKNARFDGSPAVGVSHELSSKLAHIIDSGDYGDGRYASKWSSGVHPGVLNYSIDGALGLNEYLRSGDNSGYGGLMSGPGISDLGFNKISKEDPELFEMLKDAFLLDNVASLHNGLMSNNTGKPGIMHFRHLHGNHFDNLREGDMIRDPGFMSTTRDRDVLEGLISDNANYRKDGSTSTSIFGKGISGDIDFHETLLPMDESETVFAPNTPLIYRGRDMESGIHNFDIEGYDRKDMNEETQQLKESKKPMNLNGLQDRMNDFQFEVIRPKKYDEFKQQLDHDD